MRGGLVQDDDAGRLEQQPGQRDPLLLAAGEPVPAVADDGVQALRAATATRSQICASRSAALQVGLGGLRPRVQRGSPGSCRGTGAPPGVTTPTVSCTDSSVASPQVDAADPDRAGGRVVQPRHEAGDRRLAGAATARPAPPAGPAPPRSETPCSTSAAAAAVRPAPTVLQRGQRHLVGRRVRGSGRRPARPTPGRPAAGRRPAPRATSGLRSSTSKTRSKLTSAVITSTRTFDSAVSGP